MTDDLIKRLGDPNRDWPEFGHDRREAKDRIEELEERNKDLALQVMSTAGQAADALDKLTKAVEALRGWDTAVLAELEGNDD